MYSLILLLTSKGDHSASLNTHEAEIDERLQEALLMEDPDLLVDLRALNLKQSDKYNIFWKKCESYLQECTAVHECRHDNATYLARAISVRDLLEQVSKLCPADTPIPSQQFLRLQFYPQNSRTKTAEQYYKRLPVKIMVQKRQFRKTHIDEHYCAAIFHYMREYALLFKSQSLFICLDDKHRLKVGEPNFPVAAAERGRRGLIVSLQEVVQVGDHDFTRFSIIPSVHFLCGTQHVNLGLQSIGLMRKEMNTDAEKALRNCKLLKQIRSTGEQYKKEITQSIMQPIDLLSGIMQRLELKGKHFEVRSACSDGEMEAFWEILLQIDPSLSNNDTTKDKTNDKQRLQAFLGHCCQMHHYTFCIKKCGQERCTICKPVRMDKSSFEKLRFLPDPLMQEDGHYLPFDQVFTRDTTEQDCPSLKGKLKAKPLSFSPSVQHINNTGTVIQCEEQHVALGILEKKTLSW